MLANKLVGSTKLRHSAADPHRVGDAKYTSTFGMWFLRTPYPGTRIPCCYDIMNPRSFTSRFSMSRIYLIPQWQISKIPWYPVCTDGRIYDRLMLVSMIRSCPDPWYGDDRILVSMIRWWPYLRYAGIRIVNILVAVSMILLSSLKFSPSGQRMQDRRAGIPSIGFLLYWAMNSRDCVGNINSF